MLSSRTAKPVAMIKSDLKKLVQEINNFGVYFPTSPLALIVGFGLRPSRQPPGHDWRGRRWRPPGSRAKGFCACQGLRRRGVGICLAISTQAVLPSVGRKTSAPRTCLTPLNTSPAPSPVNASRLPSRTIRASLGAGAVRYSFTVTDFHRLPFAGLPAHPSTTSKAVTPTFTWRKRLRQFRAFVESRVIAAARPILRGEHADAGAIAQLVNLIQQIDHVEPT